jgi:hypothetical protein
MARLAPWTRYGGELGALMIAAHYMQVPILAGAVLVGTPLLDLGRALPAILTADLHLVGISLLLLIPGLSGPLRISLFVAAAWIVPALASADAPLAPGTAWLDVAAALRGEGVAHTLAPAAALCLTACLLRTRPTRSASG